MAPNRLAQCTSPYLLQHAHNPVDWFPWGQEALRKAKEEDKPIFLSIGYSACHWCHVMERESFENPRVAELLNRDFVSIKVDREERPDLDDLYMGAVQALSGRGGWPMSVWLTPELKPFFGGTYFPPESRYGFPGFMPLLEGIAEAWREKRLDVIHDSLRLTQALERQAGFERGRTLPSEKIFEDALEELRRSFDPQWGGFGVAPKFPPYLALQLLLSQNEKSDRKMAVKTLNAMADGGIFDHLGGGFARYSVDAQWLIPHFEKMLYDNAQLACTYLDGFLATGDARYSRVARATLDYLWRDMRDGDGGFYSSEDADSEGVEGRFYAFTPEEVKETLGEADGALFCQAFGITTPGNFEGDSNVLHLFDAPDDLPDDDQLEQLRQRIWQAREGRVRPHRDDKILASWNGLALSSFSRGYQVLGDPRYLQAAVSLGSFLEKEMASSGRLLRTWRQGRAHTEGFLEDYSSVAIGLVDLYETTFDTHWLCWAENLLETMRREFEDPEGGFFSTSIAQTDVILRQKPVFDHSLPSANALAVLALLRVGSHLQRQDFLDSAEKTLMTFAPILNQVPRSCLGLLQGLAWVLRGPVEIIINGLAEDPHARQLMERAWRNHLPRRMMALVHDETHDALALERVAIDGKPTAYVCINRACLEPVTSPEALQNLLSRHFLSSCQEDRHAYL